MALVRRSDNFTWQRKLVEAIEAGLEQDGLYAVRAAISEALPELKIPAPLGKPVQDVPEGVRKAAGLWLRNEKASLGQLARKASMSRPAILKWTRDERFWRTVGELWADELDKADDKSK